MNYDFCAEFWDEKELECFIKKKMDTYWDSIWKTSKEQEKERPKEFEKKITEELIPVIYEEFSLAREKNYNFLMFLKVLDLYCSEREEHFNDFLYSIRKEYKNGRGKTKKAVPKFPKELVKSFYKIFVHDEGLYNSSIQYQLEIMKSLGLLPDIQSSITHLPPNSFHLSIRFSLKKPYISKDDEAFYIHDNPVSKEKVFKVPYVRASSWKGNLRWTAYMKLVDEFNSLTDEGKINKRLILARIFGNEKDNLEDYLKNQFGELNEDYEIRLREIYKKKKDEEVNFQGRLRFYPTFFDRIGLDIINPHDRKTGTGTVPITLEVVPCDTEGDLHLLYVPFDKMGENEDTIKRELREDMFIICKALKALLTDYGMSAKRTSGYGTASIKNMEFKSKLLREYERYVYLDELINELNEKTGKVEKFPLGVAFDEFG